MPIKFPTSNEPVEFSDTHTQVNDMEVLPWQQHGIVPHTLIPIVDRLVHTCVCGCGRVGW